MTRERKRSAGRPQEAGFTLIEVLTAIVILVFGLIAVTNLFIVAGNSNLVANAGTAAAAIASEQLETLRATSFLNLTPGGSLTSNVTNFYRDASTDPRLRIPGAASIQVRWQITQVQAQLLAITVRAEAQGGLLGSRTRAEFTTLRACTDPIPSAGACPAGQTPCCPSPP